MTDADCRLSILIPVLNEELCIGALLSRLQTFKGCEIIVADGGSSDKTVEIVRTFTTVRLIEGGGGRGGQINAASRVAHGSTFVILHADTALPAEALPLIENVLCKPGVAGGCFRLTFDVKTPALNFYAWCSRFETPLTTFGDQAFFMRRATFEAAGGAPDWPLLEDVELRRRLLRLGSFVKLPQTIATSARRFVKRGVVRQQLLNMAIVTAYFVGVPAQRLATWYGNVR